MKRDWAAFALALVLGAVIWALSRPITGKVEPWDANSAYYYLALLGAGFVAGLSIPARKRFHYLGAWLGQLLYMILFLPLGGLIVLGVVVLFAYTLLFLAGAVGGMWLNRAMFRRETPE